MNAFIDASSQAPNNTGFLMDHYFVQQCPTCGRPHRVRFEYLGETVQCGHCKVLFRASSNQRAAHRSHSLVNTSERSRRTVKTSKKVRVPMVDSLL